MVCYVDLCVRSLECEQLIAGIQIFYSKGVGWSHTQPVYILSANIRTAVDMVGLNAIYEALPYCEIPADLRPAMLRELFDLTGTVILAGTTTPTFSICRLKQGGAESTMLFNLLMRAIFDRAKA